MRKILIFIVFLTVSVCGYGQKTVYKNNYGTNIINGQMGRFNKSSITWTIEKKGDIYVLKSNANTDILKVSYSSFDKINKLFVYKPIGNNKFDNAIVKTVLTNGKISDYAKGKTSNNDILTIVFSDSTGLIYKLKK